MRHIEKCIYTHSTVHFYSLLFNYIYSIIILINSLIILNNLMRFDGRWYISKSKQNLSRHISLLSLTQKKKRGAGD